MIMVCADIHLEKAIRQDNKELTGDSFRALSQLQERAITLAKAARRINRGEECVLIIAGDPTEKNRLTGGAILALREFVNKLQTAGIAVWGIEGNHDAQNQNQEKPVPIIQSVGGQHFNERLIEMSGMKVYGLDWRPAEKLPEALKKVPPCDILVMHAPFQHLLSFDDAWDVKLEDIPAHVKCVIAGDVHKAQYLPAAPGRPEFISPGSLHPCDIGQGGDHGLFVGEVSIDSTMKPKVTWHQEKLITRPLLELEMKAVDQEQIQAAVLQALSTVSADNALKPVMKLVYPPEIAVALRTVLLGKELAGKAIYIPEPRYSGKLSNIRPTVEIKLDSMSLRDAVPLVADPVSDKQTYDILMMAVNSPTFGVELDGWIAGQLQ